MPISRAKGLISKILTSDTCSDLTLSIEHSLLPARLLTPLHVNLSYKSAFYSSLPEDGPMRFETWRERQKLENRIKILI